MKCPFAFLLVLVGSLVFPGIAQSVDALPDYLQPGEGHVYDYAAVLTDEEELGLENLLASVEEQTTAEFAVVTVPSLEGQPLEDFAERLFERWGVGQAARDNGLLLLAAIEDRSVRIETGYGLEAALPDAKTGRILDEQVVPSLRDGKFGDGFMLGALALADVVARESGVVLTNASTGQTIGEKTVSDPDPALAASPAQEISGLTALWLLGGFLVPVVVFMIIASRKGGIKSMGSSSVKSSGGGGSSSRSSSSGSRSSAGFGGGRSGGGGASRRW